MDDPDDQLPLDMLQSIFQLQTSLNDNVFTKQDLRDRTGQLLTMASITASALKGELSVNDMPNQWLSKYSAAMSSELDELKADLLWKWWSKDQIDLQNIRVELIDILHFLVSAMIAAGLSPSKVHDLYRQKHAVNIARQESGYNAATKSEDDNRSVK